ncbi:hypothetical protein BDR04DRAFT_1163108 [Suillus decipiens]|nr:hypothetical protein BDR04DRAFT_1163108 [Suillus decipiens]
MDYALCEAAQHNMEAIIRAITFYDINCQYNKHFQDWNLSSFPESDCGMCMAIKTAAMSGISWIDREIMETLWVHLNLISPAARGMSSLHQQVCLDYQMNDSNFCKMICMKRTLCWKYKLAKNGIAKSGRAFDRLDEAAPGHLKTEWLAQERVAQSSRIRDPAVMDLYDINIKKAPSKKEIELRLPEDDGFTRSALTHLGEGFDADEDPDNFNIDILDDLKDDPAYFTETSNIWTNTPELTIIPLPLNLGVDQCRLCMADDLILLEMLHCEGQANDALHNLCIHLCNKAILF